MSGLDKDLQGYNLATHILALEPHPELDERIDALEDEVNQNTALLKRFDISIPVAGFNSVIATTFRITIPCSFSYRIFGWRLHSTMFGSCMFQVSLEGTGVMFSPTVSNSNNAVGTVERIIAADGVLDIDLISLSIFKDITLTLKCEKVL